MDIDILSNEDPIDITPPKDRDVSRLSLVKETITTVVLCLLLVGIGIIIGRAT